MKHGKLTPEQEAQLQRIERTLEIIEDYCEAMNLEEAETLADDLFARIKQFRREHT